jgi:hypothetical protein
MTTLTLRYIKGDFVVSGPEIEPTRFKTRQWCSFPDILDSPGSVPDPNLAQFHEHAFG